MKKIAFLMVMVICMAGCFFSKTSPDYQTMKLASLEEKAKHGELGAMFWLADRYFMGQDVKKDPDKAYVYLDKLLNGLVRDPKALNASWFQKAYEQQHPVAIFLRTSFDIKKYMVDSSIENTEKEMDQIGKNLDLLFSIKGNQSIYSPWAGKMLEALQQIGIDQMCLQLGNEYKKQNKGVDASAWFSRACQFGDMEACKLFLGQW